MVIENRTDGFFCGTGRTQESAQEFSCVLRDVRAGGRNRGTRGVEGGPKVRGEKGLDSGYWCRRIYLSLFDLVQLCLIKFVGRRLISISILFRFWGVRGDL